MRFRMFVFLSFLVSVAALAQPQPEVSLPAPQRDALIGDTVKFCVLFKNANGAAPGFAPFLDLVFDENGADGPTSGPCDGVSFVSAELVGVTPSPIPLPPVAPPATLSPCGSGSPVHPFSATTTGWPPPPTYPPGSQLVSLRLPFGSFDASQPELRIEVTARVHPFADDGHPLTVRVRGGFQYGDTPLNDATGQPLFDPLGSGPVTNWNTETITPRVLFMTKRFLGAEDEVVPGPSFPEDYEIQVNVAPGQTINQLVLSDCASQDVQFLSVNAGGAVAPTPPNCFTVSYPSLVAPGSGPADTIQAHFFVTNVLPLSPNTCSAKVTNRIQVTNGTWQPLDPRDALLNVVGDASVIIQKKAIAIVKTAQILGNGPPIPPAIVRYTLTFRISDYASFGDLVIEDTLSDGLVPMLNTALWNVHDLSHSGQGPFPAGTVAVEKDVTDTYTCPAGAASTACQSAQGATTATLDGGTRVRFNLSQALGSSFPGGVVAGPATGTITFDAQINALFAFGPHSAVDVDKALDKHDPLFDHAVVIATYTPGNAKCRDDSSSCMTVPTDVLEKRVVAKNGQWLNPIPGAIATPLPRFTRGDTITYRLTKTIPSGNAEELTVEDWLPRPVLSVAGLPAMTAVPLCTPVPTTTVCYTSTPPSVFAAPSMTPSATSNSLMFHLGNLNWPPNTAVTITIDITLTVSTDPFADGLFLTNEAQECEKSSYGVRFCQTAIAQFELTEPRLRVHKGILCAGGGCPADGKTPVDDPTNDPPSNARISQPPIIGPPISKAPRAICTMPAPCPRFTGVVSSSAVAGFVGNGVTQADANDRVTFVIVVENLGNGPFGAYDIALTDLLDPNLAYVPGTLCVTRGDGVPIPTTGSFPASLILVDGTAGALGPYSPSSGKNIAVITFDAMVGPPTKVRIGSCLPNHAELTAYSNEEHGANFVAAGFTPPFFAEARVCITPKLVLKTTVTTSEPHTNMAPPQKLAIGEIIRYDLLVHVPEGSGPLQFVDTLPPGLQLITPPLPAVSTVNAANLTWGPLTTTGTSGNITFDFGTVVNADDDPECEYLRVAFNALVLNTASNNDGDAKVNQFSVKANSSVIGTSNAVSAVIVEPKLSITKTVVQQGTTVLYTVTVTNSSAVTAFDAVISDVTQASLSGLTVVNAVSSGGASPPVTTGTDVHVDSIPPGGSVTVTLHARIECNKCDELNNTATVRWTSLPGTGTSPNPTGSVTPGASGAVDGERDGSGGPINDYIATATASVCGKVCGIKFFDRNGNGIEDAGEPGLAGWTITATDAYGAVVASTTTDKGGKYCLTLLPGTYQICETPQPKWQQTFPGPSPACHTVAVGAGALMQPIDFGNRECWARVCGTKWSEGRGLANVPLPGWTIVAYPLNVGPPITTVTDAKGHYCLELPGPGAYTLSEVQHTGWDMTEPDEPYKIYVECVPSQIDDSPGSAVVQGGSANALALDFHNVNLCATKKCSHGQQCVVQNGAAVCITQPPISPCATVRCATGTKCTVINGQAVCVP